MTNFAAKLEHMHDQNTPALFEFGGRLYPGRIASVSDDYVLIEIEQNDKTVLLHKHISAVGFITGSSIMG